MARLFGYVGNRPDLGPFVLKVERDALRVEGAGDPLGWGIGFYQGGEILLRRRPLDEHRDIEVADLGDDVRADVLIGHVRSATVGSLRTENTHPFRYRQWLFAHTGTLDGFTQLAARLSEALPEFLRRNLRGETDSELLFHVFLSFLHDAGQLQSAHVPPAATRDALRATLAHVARLRADVAAEDRPMNLLLTDGEQMVGVRCGATMAWRDVHGRPDLLRAIGEERLRQLRIPDLGGARFTLVASDFDREPRGFEVVPPRSLLTLDRSHAPSVEPL